MTGIRLEHYAGIVMLIAVPLLCGGCTTITLSENNPSEYIVSPNWPQDYPNDKKACWKITSTSSTRPRLYLSEQSFSLEYCSGCRCDYLQLTDPYRGMSWLYCGSNAFGRFITDGDMVTLDFSSDEARTYNGFQILVEITDEYRNSGLSTWAIVTITLISLALVALLVGILIMSLKSRKVKRTTRQSTSTTNQTVRMTGNTQAPPSYTDAYPVAAPMSAPCTAMPQPPMYSEIGYPQSAFTNQTYAAPYS